MLQRLGADRLDPGFGEDAERAEHGRAVEERGGADLPGARAGRAFPLVDHVELLFLEIPPPAGETGTRAEVLAVDIERAGAARPAVQVFVGAPEGEIDVPVVETMRHRADRVGAVEPGDDAALAGGGGDALDVEELARAVEDAPA